MSRAVPHEFRLRVYWEDTDAAGIVYYANYLKFIERARTEMLLDRGLTQTGLRAGAGIVFAVREVAVRYLVPARLEDQLVVSTTLLDVGGARLELAQDVARADDGRLLAAARVVLAALDEAGRPRRLPAEVRAALTCLGPGTGSH